MPATSKARDEAATGSSASTGSDHQESNPTIPLREVPKPNFEFKLPFNGHVGRQSRSLSGQYFTAQSLTEMLARERQNNADLTLSVRLLQLSNDELGRKLTAAEMTARGVRFAYQLQGAEMEQLRKELGQAMEEIGRLRQAATNRPYRYCSKTIKNILQAATAILLILRNSSSSSNYVN